MSDDYGIPHGFKLAIRRARESIRYAAQRLVDTNQDEFFLNRRIADVLDLLDRIDREELHD